MELEKTVEDQRSSSSSSSSSLFCFKINILSTWIPALALIPFATLLMLGSLSIPFTSTVLMLSTVVLVFAKRKPKLLKESAAQQGFNKSGHSHDEEEIVNSPQTEDPLPLASSKQEQQQQQQQHEEEDCCLVRSPDVLSENECVDYQLSTTEDSEVEWPFRDNMDQSPDYSEDDGSISDEDSLIEISLPGGHYVSSHHHKEEDQVAKFSSSMQQKLLPADSFFHQRTTLMELLAELNEMNELEENLIEIDISMGSIKCSRFEIEA